MKGSPATEDTDSRLDEYTANLYAGFGRQFGKVGLTASLAGEYYRMGDYENWSLYPQASLNWMPSERHILQLNFSSDKEYPAYWEMQGAISYIDGYSEIHGNGRTPPLAALRGAGLSKHLTARSTSSSSSGTSAPTTSHRPPGRPPTGWL